jgi:succinyl-CoA synthetase alpha subunit
MIYRRGQRVLVQGITGKQGSFWAQKMIECGTNVAGGVNPKRAGDTHLGVPISAPQSRPRVQTRATCR